LLPFGGGGRVGSATSSSSADGAADLGGNSSSVDVLRVFFVAASLARRRSEADLGWLLCSGWDSLEIGRRERGEGTKAGGDMLLDRAKWMMHDESQRRIDGHRNGLRCRG